MLCSSQISTRNVSLPPLTLREAERFHQSRSDVTAPNLTVPGRSLIANKIPPVGNECTDTEMLTCGAPVLPLPCLTALLRQHLRPCEHSTYREAQLADPAALQGAEVGGGPWRGEEQTSPGPRQLQELSPRQAPWEGSVCDSWGPGVLTAGTALLVLFPPSILASDEDLAPATLPPDHTQTVHGPELRPCPRNLGTQLQT